MSAGAGPAIGGAGTPAAERAPDARAGGIVALIERRVGLDHDRGTVGGKRTHASILCRSSKMEVRVITLIYASSGL